MTTSCEFIDGLGVVVGGLMLTILIVILILLLFYGLSKAIPYITRTVIDAIDEMKYLLRNKK